MSLFRKAAALLAAPSIQAPLAIAQRLDYDVLSYIFTLSSSDWEGAGLTLHSVCRLWQSTAVSMPQLWSTIYFETFIHPKYISMVLARSQSLPLHIRLHSAVNNKHLEALKSIRDRVISMTVDEKHPPIQQTGRLGVHDMWRTLSRTTTSRLLQAMNIVLDNDTENHNMWRRLSQTPLYLLSQGMNIARDYETEILMSYSPNYRLGGFPALQKLDISCDVAYWSKIIRNMDETIVSLHIRVTGRSVECTFPLMFRQLRHLRITTYDDAVDPVLNIYAPSLESFDERYDFGLITHKQIQLLDSPSVTHLHTGNLPLELTSYPALRVLWLRDMAQYAQEYIIPSLQAQISHTPELKQVGYYDHTHYIQPKEQDLPNRLPSPFFSEIFTLIRATGRDIVIREFIPSDLNLPGSSGF